MTKRKVSAKRPRKLGGAAVATPWDAKLTEVVNRIGKLQDAATAAENRYLTALSTVEQKQRDLIQFLSMYSSIWRGYSETQSDLYNVTAPADVKLAYENLISVRGDYLTYSPELIKLNKAAKDAEVKAAETCSAWRLAVDKVSVANIKYLAASCIANNHTKSPITKAQVNSAVTMARREVGLNP